MSKNYRDLEIDKIINNERYEFPKNIAMACAWILGNFKGLNLKVFNVQGSSSLADFYILGSATNSTQAKSMADEIDNQLRRNGIKGIQTEGDHHSDWILIDAKDIIVHIFLDQAREIYDLDNLWAGAVPEEIPKEYYFSDDDSNSSESGGKGYF